MKRFLLTALLFAVTLTLVSQTRPPAKVKKAFAENYAEATDARWSSKGERLKEWRVLYKLDGILHSSWYDHKGNWLVTKSKIDKNDLPEPVLKGIDSDYYNYDIVITARFEDPENKGYEVWLDNGREGFNVQYSAEGKVLLRTITSAGYKPIDDDGNIIRK